jgi:F-type H+-transporting ATPase subunit b
LILAAEEEREGLDLVLPEMAELVGGAIAFLIVFFFLAKFAWPRIQETVQSRENTIQKSLEDAEGAKNEAQGILDEYKAQLADARSEANRVIEEARQSAEQVRKDMIAKAERDAEGVVAKAQEQIEAERQRTVQELQTTIANLSLDLAEKVVGRSLDRNAQSDLVDAYIREVSGMSSPNGGGNN